MTITIGNTSNNAGEQNKLTTTISHTPSSGSNSILLALIAICHDKDDPVPGASMGVSSITFNTTEVFTKLRADPGSSGGTEPDSEIWYLVNPTATTANVVLTYVQTQFTVDVSCIDFLGVDQASPFEANAGKNQTGGTSMSNTITTLSANAYIISVIASKVNDAIAKDASQTTIFANNQSNVGAGANLASHSTYELKATAGSDTQSFTSIGDDDAALSICVLKPQADTTAFPNQMCMMGVT